MINIIRFNRIGLLFIFFLLVSLYCYYGVSKTYFRQDEWYSMGEVFSSGPFAFLQSLSILEILTGKIRPIGTVIHNIFIFFFPLQIFPFLTYGMFFHACNALLIFFLSEKITKSFVVSIIASLLFLSSYAIGQALFWFAATVTTIGSTFFFLLSINVFIEYIEKQKHRMFLLSYVFMYIAALFKENAMIGFLILPLTFFIFKKNNNRYPSVFLLFSPSFAFILLLIFGRVMPLFSVHVGSAYLHFSEKSSLYNLFIHTMIYPLVSFSQQFIPRNIAFKLAVLYQNINYPLVSQFTNHSVWVENIITDIISLLATSCFLLFSFFLCTYFKEIRKPIFFLVLSSMMSFIPYIILKRGTSYLDSRYYYLGLSLGAILLSILWTYSMSWIKKYIHSIGKYAIFFVFFAFLGFYIYKNIVFIHREIMSMKFYTTIQKKFLGEMKRIYPEIKNNDIMYLTGNREFYGVKNLYVPLQAGPGYVLLVWYSQTNNFISELLKDSFFYDFREKGYKKLDNGIAFGYYDDFNHLYSDYKNGIFTIDQIYAFFYDGSSYELKNITKEIRAALEENIN